LPASYRAKGSIGWIVPPRCNETVIEEAFRIRPPGVSWAFASLGMADFGQEHYERALAAIEDATRDLVAREAAVIVYSGMPLTARREKELHDEVEARIRAVTRDEIPTITDTKVVVLALRALGVQRPALITPYQADTLANVKAVFETLGFDVAAAVGREWSLAQLITQPEDDTAYKMALKAHQATATHDGFYLGCPQWPVVGNIAPLEKVTSLPVVTQVQAIMWWTAHYLELDANLSGFGRLFSETVGPTGQSDGG
jgi:maleate cis-trans isomerase